MAELFNIMKISIGADKLRARVLVNPNMPVRTSEDIEATARVYYLAPAIADHLCLGDAGSRFQECMSDTELAHLLEHLSVEIMNETGLADDVTCGRTRSVPGDERLFDIELSCPDDALTVGALSSAAFMMDWAYLYADAPAPDFPGTVTALRHLVLTLRGEGEEAPVATDAPEQAVDQVEPAFEPSARIDTEGVRPRAPLPGNPPAKRVADVAPVFGGAAAEGVQAAFEPASLDPDATVRMEAISD